MFVYDCASSYMIVATVANSWFTQDPANVTRFGSSYAGHKLLTKSIKKGFDTILKGIPQHTNNRVRAWFILFTFEFSISMDLKLAVIFFCFFLEEDEYFCYGLLAEKSDLCKYRIFYIKVIDGIKSIT